MDFFKLNLKFYTQFRAHLFAQLHTRSERRAKSASTNHKHTWIRLWNCQHAVFVRGRWRPTVRASQVDKLLWKCAMFVVCGQFERFWLVNESQRVAVIILQSKCCRFVQSQLFQTIERLFSHFSKRESHERFDWSIQYTHKLEKEKLCSTNSERFKQQVERE